MLILVPGNLSWVHCHWSDNFDFDLKIEFVIDLKIEGSVLKVKVALKMLEFSLFRIALGFLHFIYWDTSIVNQISNFDVFVFENCYGSQISVTTEEFEQETLLCNVAD